MPPFIDLTNQTFNRLTVIERTESAKHGGARWKCQCSCGNIKIVNMDCLRSGDTQSCGCLQKESRISHGKCGTPEYSCWRDMIQRCHNPNNQAFKHYGARGITVCNEWRNDFYVFYNAMKKRPSSEYTLERINNDKGYFKENCEWQTWGKQATNRRSNHRIELHGWDLTVTEWAQFVGLNPSAIFSRLHKLKWPPAKAIFSPKGRWFKHC